MHFVFIKPPKYINKYNKEYIYCILYGNRGDLKIKAQDMIRMSKQDLSTNATSVKCMEVDTRPCGMHPGAVPKDCCTDSAPDSLCKNQPHETQFMFSLFYCVYIFMNFWRFEKMCGNSRGLHHANASFLQILEHLNSMSDP